jgi:hypothetical protein
MRDFPHITKHRAILGGLIGFLAFAVDAISTLIRYVLNPFVAERATRGSFLAMFLFLVLFIAGGALAGYLSSIKIKWLRFVVIGTLAGALGWSYLIITWPLTARASALFTPQTSVLSAMLIGAGAGALGGALLFLIGVIRRHMHDYR